MERILSCGKQTHEKILCVLWKKGMKKERKGRRKYSVWFKYFSTCLCGAFSSRASYETKYLELSGAIILLKQCAGRCRIAACLQGEHAEIYIL